MGKAEKDRTCKRCKYVSPLFWYIAKKDIFFKQFVGLPMSARVYMFPFLLRRRRILLLRCYTPQYFSPGCTGLPTIRGKNLKDKKSSVRGKQKFAQRGIFVDSSQGGNYISAVCGKSQSGVDGLVLTFLKVQVQVTNVQRNNC